jgi:TatD DNase family protein
MFIDTHTHLYDEKFNDDRSEMILRAIAGGVECMYLPNCDSSTIDGMLQVEQEFPGYCKAMMGLHPCYVKENYKTELGIVETWLKQRKFAAVGEVGLDYYWDKTFVAQQQEAFETQMEWALAYNLPVVIHTRDAMQQTVDTVKPFAARGLRGVFHCFTGSYEMAKEIIDFGFYLGIGGVVTYKNAGVQEVVQQIPLEHIVLETDAPYLTPHPFRGKRNESLYVKLVAEKIAELNDISVEEVAQITTRNAGLLFVE